MRFEPLLTLFMVSIVTEATNLPACESGSGESGSVREVQYPRNLAPLRILPSFNHGYVVLVGVMCTTQPGPEAEEIPER